MSSTFLYKAYQQIDLPMVKSNAMVSTKTISALPLNWNKYRIRFIITITIPYIWRFLFNILGPFVPDNPHHTWLNDCETIMNFLGLVLWHKQLYLGVTLLMFNESCFCIWKVPNWIIVNRGGWLWSPVNIKGSNKDAKI